MSDRAYNRVLTAWAKDYKKENLTSEVKRLIAQASMDLYVGPVDEDDYPGFESACKTIKSVLSEVPSTLYIDTESETWSDDEPSGSEGCPECEGEGCETCDGVGHVNVPLEGVYKVEKSDLIKAIVGKELASHIQ